MIPKQLALVAALAASLVLTPLAGATADVSLPTGPTIVQSTPVVAGSSVYALNLMSTGAVGAIKVLPEVHGPDRHTIRSQWIDRNGIERFVETSFPVTRTPEQIRELIRGHEEIVDILKDRYPPAPRDRR